MARENPYIELSTAFKSGNFEPLYLLYGEEKWFIDRLQKLLLAHALEPHERDFNLDILYGNETDARSALGACQAFPMMAQRRVVVIRDFDRMKDNSVFKSLAENLNPACVVFLVCAGKPNMSRHPYRALREKGHAVEFKALYPNQVPRWVEVVGKEHGFALEPKAAQMLAEFVGSSLSAISAEIGKLATYVGEREVITAEDIVQASGQTRDYNVFELQRAVGERQIDRVLHISERLLQQSSNPKGECTIIVSILTAFFIKLWQLTGLQAGRIPEKAMASAVGVSPFFLKEYLACLRRFDSIALDRAFSALIAADFELKGGSQRSDRLILDLMFRKILTA
ncbi:MAG: DNA polymerase III subunit delta [Bacteroidetes bacterium]|nr:DNA polymerase III subunit delta [Bacteroidota bacterium]